MVGVYRISEKGGDVAVLELTEPMDNRICEVVVPSEAATAMPACKDLLGPKITSNKQFAAELQGNLVNTLLIILTN